MSECKPVVLVVDDIPENITILSAILRDRYTVKVATSGEKALRIARSEPRPDIVLLDIMMPGMSGHEVCERLKQDPLTAPIPVIFITAKSEIEDEQRGLELGAVDYITKPFSPVIVEARVRTHLALYEQKQTLRRENKGLRDRIAGGFRDMAEADLQDIVRSGEGPHVEFKSTLRWNLHSDKADKKIENQCLKTVAAYLNSDGGVLLAGVDDDGRVLGLEKDRFASEDRLLLHWNSLLKAHVGVEFAHLIRSAIQDLDGQRVLVAQCLRSSKPVFFRRDNEELFFVRAGNGSQHLKPSEVLAYMGQRASEPE